jgi:hypothetical protein
LFLLLAKQFATDEHVLGGLLMEEVTAHFVDVLLSHLLHTELTSPLNDLLVPTYHPSQTHEDRTVVGLTLVLLPLDEEGGLGKVGNPNLDIFRSANLSGRCKLLVFNYTPAKVLLEVLSAQPVHAAELPQRDLYLPLVVVLPERQLAISADGDRGGEEVVRGRGRLSEEVSAQHLFVLRLMVALPYPQDLQIALLPLVFQMPALFVLPNYFFEVIGNRNHDSR